MSKLALSFLVLVSALTLSVPIKAQWYDNDPCNRTYSDGFKDKDGSGKNGAMRIRFYITTHYTAEDIETVKKNLVPAMVSLMNDYSGDMSYNVRFEGADWNDDPSTYNFTLFLDVYHREDDTYRIYVCMHGWGAGHLCRFSSDGTSTDIEKELASAANEAVDRFENGWTCAD
ncbi:MAG TPA: hypothetical protein VLX91_13935 [Candidatus Acidoferrales bacterium]|nr:hypothetical protein [Candidatus Acidoferrales bacterium]